SIRCTLPPDCSQRPQIFHDIQNYEQHYRLLHSQVCLDCKKRFPSAYFLELHIAEIHDPFTAARRDRGEKIYKCFDEYCDKLCSTPQKRRMHLIAKHGFPKEYMFNVVAYGLQ
ncbi:uncharacterized protein V1516DRAFT_607725, partial [Lipomyces oligophaga]|uniref:uncharacterized protein n=1 Tax=Lipomyces oligophaga TaxID=45792 RepID=UPI0034CD2BCF